MYTINFPVIAPSAAHNFSVKTIEFKMAAVSVKRSNFFFFFFVMVVANCNASCDWLYVRCSQWELLLFFHLDSSLHLSQYGRFHAVSFETASRDAQTLNLPRNVSKFNAQQVVSLMNEQQSQSCCSK